MRFSGLYTLVGVLIGVASAGAIACSSDSDGRASPEVEGPDPVVPDPVRPDPGDAFPLCAGAPPSDDFTCADGGARLTLLAGGAHLSFGLTGLTNHRGTLYLFDSGVSVIRRINPVTGDVDTLTLASTLYMESTIGQPLSPTLVSDRDQYLYLAAQGMVRRIDPATHEVTVIAGVPVAQGHFDGIGEDVRFQNIVAAALGDQGMLYVRDDATIRQVDVATGEVTTLAGSPDAYGSDDGIGADARFSAQATPFANGMAADCQGNVYVVDGARIRRVVASTGEVTTVADSFTLPSGLESDCIGNLYVADTTWLGTVELATGQVTTLAGSRNAEHVDGSKATFQFVRGMTSDCGGNLYIVDGELIRKVEIATGETTFIVGSSGLQGIDGIGAAARFTKVNALESDGQGNLYVGDNNILLSEADRYPGAIIRRVMTATGEVTTLAGQQGPGPASDGVSFSASFAQVSSLALDDDRGILYMSDIGTTRSFDVATGEVRTLAPVVKSGVLTGGGDGMLYTYDGSAICAVNVSNSEVTTIAGITNEIGRPRDGVGPDAAFAFVTAIASDGAGNLYVGESNPFGDSGGTIRKIEIATGEVTTLAGSHDEAGHLDGVGSDARFSSITAVIADRDGNLLYVADGGTIRKIVLATAEVTTYLGSTTLRGIDLCRGTLSAPSALALLPDGTLVIADGTEGALLLVNPE